MAPYFPISNHHSTNFMPKLNVHMPTSSCNRTFDPISLSVPVLIHASSSLITSFIVCIYVDKTQAALNAIPLLPI